MKKLSQIAQEELSQEDTKKVISRIKTALARKEECEHEIKRLNKEIAALDTKEGAQEFLSKVRNNNGGGGTNVIYATANALTWY